MMIRDRKTGQTFFEAEWRAWLLANGGPSFEQLTPEVMEACGADPVFEGPQPTLTRYQTAAQQGVVKKADGHWYTNWVAVDMDADAKAAADARQADAVRSDRNGRLASCDWTQLADAPVDTAAWSSYRAALRDVPAQAGFPWDVTWPTAPGAA